jgi:hypothetical protein
LIILNTKERFLEKINDLDFDDLAKDISLSFLIL